MMMSFGVTGSPFFKQGSPQGNIASDGIKRLRVTTVKHHYDSKAITQAWLGTRTNS